MINILIKLILATILGGLIGFERESQGTPAGIRTHLLVCLGSTLSMMISIALPLLAPELSHTLDPSRIASMVIAGIGFLGSGVIIQDKGNIWGLTTAACLWTTATIGLAIGCGFYIPAFIVTFISIVILHLLKSVESFIRKSWYYNLKIVANHNILKQIKTILIFHEIDILTIKSKRDIQNQISTFQIRIRTNNEINETLITILETIKGIQTIKYY